MEEYAKVTTIFVAKELCIKYSYDLPGVHFVENSAPVAKLQESFPEYSLDFIADDGNWTYGPWAERQRVLIQDYFFPVHYQTLLVTKFVQPGEIRIYNTMDISFRMTGQSSSIKIPFRLLSNVI